MPLPWFRRPKAKVDQAPSEAAPPTVEPEPPIAPAARVETRAVDEQPTATAIKKRRRGSRGGRGRKKKPAGAAAATAVADAEAAELAPESAPKPARRRSGEQRSGEPKSEPKAGEQKSSEEFGLHGSI